MTETHASAPDASTDPDGAVRFDTKIAVLLRDDLLPWQELNVTAFLVSGITKSAEDLTGDPYRDADGTTYLAMLRQPVLVHTASKAQLATARAKAVSRGLATAIYTHELFSTGHDAANRAAVAGVAGDDLDLVGLAVRGPRNGVDRVTKGCRLHG